MSDRSARADTFFVHPQALCESKTIGEKTRIWAFAHVLPGARIGRDCNICDHVFIENDVVIGERVTVKCGVQLWDGVRARATTSSSDPTRRSRTTSIREANTTRRRYCETHVGRGASIGGGAAILPGLRIGAHAMVGAGSVVTHDVPARAIVSGNPARIVGYVDARRAIPGRGAGVPAPWRRRGPRDVGSRRHHPSAACWRTISGVRCRRASFRVRFPSCPSDTSSCSTFPDRTFAASTRIGTAISSWSVRAGLSPSSSTTARPARRFRSTRRISGSMFRPMIWAVQYKYSPDALLLVFASDPYDPDDYIRDYDDFLSAIQKTT